MNMNYEHYAQKNLIGIYEVIFNTDFETSTRQVQNVIHVEFTLILIIFYYLTYLIEFMVNNNFYFIFTLLNRCIIFSHNVTIMTPLA